jgi:hypothetical protein
VKYYVESVLVSKKEPFYLIYKAFHRTLKAAHAAGRKDGHGDFRPSEYAVYSGKSKGRPLAALFRDGGKWRKQKELDNGPATQAGNNNVPSTG